MNDPLEKRTQELESELSEREELPLVTLSHLLGTTFPKAKWLIEGLVPAASITAFSGEPSSYKTWVVLRLALDLAEGTPLFGTFATHRTSVLLVDEENGLPILQDRLNTFSANPDLPIYFRSYQDFLLKKDSVEELLKLCKEFDIGLVIFDSLVRIHAEDENDAGKMSRVFKLLAAFKKNGIGVLFTHHNRKQGFGRRNAAQDMRGSSDILAAVDCHLAVSRKDTYLVIKQTKLRQQQEAKPFKIDIVDGDGLVFEYGGQVDEATTNRDEAKRAIPELLEQEGRPLYQQELFEKVRASGINAADKTLRDVVKDLAESDAVLERRGDKKKLFYSLPPSEPSQQGLPKS